jgi:hypothetical protein
VSMMWMLISLAVGVSVAAWVISASVYAIWLRRQTEQDAEQRKTLDRIVQASMPPAAPGLNRKRVS